MYVYYHFYSFVYCGTKMLITYFAQSAGAVEYTNCTSAEG